MPIKLQFSPSILASKHFNYEILIQDLITADIKAMHFDLMDGSVTPGMGLNPNLISIIPEDVVVDIHIMSDRPLQLLKTIPARKNTYVHTHITMCKNYADFITQAQQQGFKVGITIGLNDDLSIILPYLNNVSWINFMSVAQIGMTNQVFDRHVYHNIKTIKHHVNHPCLMAIDGSVRLEHLTDLKAMVDIIVVGSLIYNATHYKAQIKELFNILNS